MDASERNRRAYDVWAETYDFDRPPHTFLEEAEIMRLLDPNAKDSVLDAACGTGRYSALLADRCAQVIGCDNSEVMLEKARLKVPKAQFMKQNLNEPLVFSDDSFSKVVCSLSIRHIEKLSLFLSEVYRVLKHGGAFVFSAIHPEMDWTSYERACPPPIELNDEGQIFPYSLPDLHAALGSACFDDILISEIRADESIKKFLTPASYAKQAGKKYVIIFSSVRTR